MFQKSKINEPIDPRASSKPPSPQPDVKPMVPKPGEIRSADVTVNGKVTGRIKGQKVRLASSARVDGDITHSSLAMEEGADFEGSIHRADDPLKGGRIGGGSVMDLTDADTSGKGKPA